MANHQIHSLDPPGHDIIVIGASTGGVEALSRLVAALPADLPAAVFVVLHTAPYQRSFLPEILNRAGTLHAVLAVDGERIISGRAYIAPPDNHLTIQDGHVRVARGPRENGHRPAVDPLFRTAARAYGPRVIGVVLTGALDCGTAGLLAVKSLRGIAVVQDPAEAACADMPESAISHIKVDHIVPLSKMAPLLVRLVKQPVISAMSNPSEEKGSESTGAKTGTPSTIACPECGGSMVESEENKLLQYRCHVGHAFSPLGMLLKQSEALESALWAAMRALQESEALAERMAACSDRKLAPRFHEKAQAMRQHAEVIREILLSGETLTPAELALEKKEPD